MPKRYSTHHLWGGIFEISEDGKAFICLVEPTHETWTRNNRDVARDWLGCQKLIMGERFINSEFPISCSVDVFEFKDKIYINMGEGELGFKKIRSANNIDTYVRPIT